MRQYDYIIISKEMIDAAKMLEKEVKVLNKLKLAVKVITLLI